MMSKTTWGVVVAVVAALIVVLAASRGYLPIGTESEETGVASDSGTPVPAEGGADGERETAGTNGSGESAATREAGEESATGASSPRQEESDTALQEEAESYVEQLGVATEEPLEMGSAEQFAAPDQPVAAGSAGATGETVPDGGPGEAEGGEPEGETPASGKEADSAAGEGMSLPDVEEAGAAGNGDTGISTDITPTRDEAPEEVAETGVPESGAGDAGQGEEADSPGGEVATVDLPLTEESPVTIAELLGPEETIPSDAVLYVHTVKPSDNQGIWGIIHNGIVRNFAEGVAVNRGTSTETYQVDIPRNADERKADNTSSFLGRLIYEKMRQSYVYNYRTDRVGRNPDLIIPGEEIVIVSFTPEELVAVYKHFVEQEE